MAERFNLAVCFLTCLHCPVEERDLIRTTGLAGTAHNLLYLSHAVFKVYTYS